MTHPSLSRRTRSRVVAVAALAAMTLLTGACGSGGGDAAGGDKNKQELVVGSIYEHDGFDPLNPLSASANGERLVPVFDTLLKVGKNGDVEPYLAQSMESTDSKTWTMTLRPDVTFTDGTPLDAKAVIFNLERHRAPDSPSSSKGLLEQLKSVEAQSPTVVKFELAAPNASFPYLFTASGALGLIGSPKALAADAKGFNSKPVGAGPYMVTEWVPDDHVTMKANPKYWGKKVAFKTLTYKVLPDPQARENALRSGQLDITVSAANFKALQADKNLTLNTGGNRGGIALLPNVKQAPLNDVRVRKAIQSAFDPKNTRNVIYGDSNLWDGSMGCLPFAEGSSQCEKTTIKPDVAAAKKLVAEYLAEGKPGSVEILASNANPALSNYVQQVVREIGLDPKVRAVGPAEHIPALYSGKFQLGIFTMAPFESFYPMGYTLFDSQGRNLVGHNDAPLDQALEASVNGATIEERDSGLKAAQKRWHEEALMTWLAPTPLYVTTRKGVSLGDGYLGGLSFYMSDVHRN